MGVRVRGRFQGLGHTTKEITLTWSLEPGLSLANLTVTESGTPALVLNQPVSSPPGTGTVPLTVTYGKTYTARLRQAITNVPLGSPLTITTKLPGIPDVGCALQCITRVDVEPHGGWAQFTIKTNETAVITLEASTTPPNGNGAWSNPDDVTASNGTVLPTDNWTPPLANLQSNTTYHYVVRARENGKESVRIGSFKTLTRRVDVTFAEIQMIDDSDGPVDGNCDCWFYFGVGDATPLAYGSYLNQKSIASDTTVDPDATARITNAPSEIWLRAMGNDGDDDFYEFCPFGVLPPEDWESSGNADLCKEWAGGQVLVSLSRQGPPWAPGDVDEQFTESFSISVNGELVYKVRGTYKVTYVP